MKEFKIDGFMGSFHVIDFLLGFSRPMGIGLTLAWLWILWMFVIFLKGVKAGILENHERKNALFLNWMQMLVILATVFTLLVTIAGMLNLYD